MQAMRAGYMSALAAHCSAATQAPPPLQAPLLQGIQHGAAQGRLQQPCQQSLPQTSAVSGLLNGCPSEVAVTQPRQGAPGPQQIHPSHSQHPSVQCTANRNSSTAESKTVLRSPAPQQGTTEEVCCGQQQTSAHQQRCKEEPEGAGGCDTDFAQLRGTIHVAGNTALSTAVRDRASTYTPTPGAHLGGATGPRAAVGGDAKSSSNSMHPAGIAPPGLKPGLPGTAGTAGEKHAGSDKENAASVASKTA